MSDSSDDDWSEDWVPYSQRPEWADVSPIPQDDGEHPVVAIAYSPRFREVFDYFRAILAKNEVSSRALELTADALRLNAANYTVWHYRRYLLRRMNNNLLHNELDYTEKIISQNSKNYQVWYHRRVIVELLNDASNELEMTERTLRSDAKNYHAWEHRQWAIKTFNLYNGELEFVDRLISEDIRNNSAWNQRFFIVKYLGFTSDVIFREIEYVKNHIYLVKNNESAWNYLRGILKESYGGLLTQFVEVKEFCENLYNVGTRSPHLIAFLIDLYTEECMIAKETHQREVISQKVFSLCDDMSKKYDIIRRKYWQYIADQLKDSLDKKSG